MPNDDTTPPVEAVWSPSLARSAGAALLGGAIACAIVQSSYPFFAFADIPELGLSPTQAQLDEFMNAQKDFYSRNYAASLAVVGACLGMFFAGLTVPRRRLASAFVACLLGAAGSAIAGYLAGLTTAEELTLSKDQSLTGAALISFGIWAAMASGIAVGASLCQGNPGVLVKSLISAWIAAVLVVVAIILVFTVAFPGANLLDHIPLSLSERVVWIATGSLTFGAAMAIALKPAKTVPSTEDSTASSMI